VLLVRVWPYKRHKGKTEPELTGTDAVVAEGYLINRYTEFRAKEFAVRAG
jgi:hypothetical protein